MLATYTYALIPTLALGGIGWLYSLYKHDVSIVDSLWSLMFLIASLTYALAASGGNARTALVLGLVAIWALRLSVHLTIRNWGQPEDRRYVQIRKNNEPNFGLKSIYIVFGLQGLLAWIISVPLLVSLTTITGFHWLDFIALTLWCIGLGFETAADKQLLTFQRNPANQDAVLDTGVWRYSRHPNYFGEFCIWWAFYLFAIPAGGWWTIYAPLLMSFLLLKVSGVVMMEKGITSRRPGYQAYIERTSTFFPMPPRTSMSGIADEVKS